MQPAAEKAKRGKLDSVTILFGFGMLLVVLGHSYPDMEITGNRGIAAAYLLVAVIYAFHMPLFFFISGYLYFHTTRGREERYGTFLWKKCKRLLVPYFTISTLAFPVKAASSRYALHPVSFTWHDYAVTLAYPWKNTIIFFWFLPTLFLIFCAAPLLRKGIGNTPSRWLIAAGLVALNLLTPFRSDALLNWQGTLNHFVYFYAGMLLAHARPGGIHVRSAALASVCVLVFIPCFLHQAWLPSPLLLALSGIGVCLTLAEPPSGRMRDGLLFIGTYSYDIYLISWFPQVAARALFYDMLHLGFWLAALCMLVSGLVIPILLVRWMAPAVARVSAELVPRRERPGD